MATSTYGTPYVQGSDLVSAYPTASSNLATRVDEVSYKRNGLNAQTGTTYTLVVGDAGKTITLSNASPVAVTLPQDSTADLPDGAVVTFYNLGAGAVTISQGTGATLQGGSITLAQYAVTSVIKLSANTYGKFDGAGTPGLSLATPSTIANSGGTATLSGNTVTFTGVNSVSLNSCFTSTYSDYRIVCSYSASVSGTTYLRYRTAGTDNTSLTYEGRGVDVGALTAATYTAVAQHSVSSNGVTGNGFTMDVLNPQETDYTHNMWSHVRFASGLFVTYQSLTGIFTATTSFDGFTLYPATGTITGTVAVYGYGK